MVDIGETEDDNRVTTTLFISFVINYIYYVLK